MKHTVLFVDDDAHLLQGLARVLRNQPYRILTAHNADEATWIMKTQRVDVIVSDETMPGMSGSAFLSWVAEKFPETVRILLTGQPSVSTAVKAVNDARVFRFLVKPCHECDLASAIRDGLDTLPAPLTLAETNGR